MKKIAKGIKRKLFKPFKRSRNRIPASQNVDPQGDPSSQKVEDTLHLHPSNKDLTTPAIPSDSVNQLEGLSGEPSSQVHAAHSGEEEAPDHQLVAAELQSARDGIQSVGLLGRHATPMASAGVNAPVDLDAVDNFETTYHQPLKTVDTVLEKIANVHPYAKMALGVLSAASKIIIAQAERDKSILSLLENTGSMDKTVRLWDAATGQPVGEPLRGHTDSVKSVSFSADGTRSMQRHPSSMFLLRRVYMYALS